MKTDPIVQEVRKAREAYVARFNYDPEAIYVDLKAKEREEGRKRISRPPKRCDETDK